MSKKAFAATLAAVVVGAGLLFAPGGAAAQSPESGSTAQASSWADSVVVASTSYNVGDSQYASQAGPVVVDGSAIVPGVVIEAGGVFRAAVKTVGEANWTLLSSATHAAGYPSLVVDTSGDLWAMWVEAEIFGGGANDTWNVVYAARRDPVTGWQEPTALTVAGGFQRWMAGSQFRLLASGDDSVTAVWTELTGAQVYAWARTFGPEGWGPAVRSTTTLESLQFFQASDGTVIGAGGTAGGTGIAALTLAPGASEWSGPVTMPSSPFAFTQLEAFRQVGDEVWPVLAESNWPTYRISAASAGFVRDFAPAEGATHGAPFFISLGDSVLAVWVAKPANGGAQGLVWSLRDAAGTWSEPATLDSAQQGSYDTLSVHLVADGLGGVRAAWLATLSDGARVRYAHFTPGSGWTSPVDLTEPDPTANAVHGIYNDGEGGFYVVADRYANNTEITSVFHVRGELPVGDWPACVAADDEMCVEDVRVEIGGQVVDHAAAGLRASVTTLAGSPGGPTSFNWSLGGAWDRDDQLPVGFNAALTNADITMVVRTGAWRPMYTVSLSSDLRIRIAGNDIDGRTMTISGKPVHIDWDPSLASCGGLMSDDACGDDLTRATPVGSGFRFMGNTQDMGGLGWSDADRRQRGGMYIATDAQGGPHSSPVAVQFLPGSNYWFLMIGNPHLDVSGSPVTGSFNAWLPESYFTAMGKTVQEAVAGGVSLSTTDDNQSSWLAPDLASVDGGVSISLEGIGYSRRQFQVWNAPMPPQPAGAPVDLRVELLQNDLETVKVTWNPSPSGAAPEWYRVEMYDSATTDVPFTTSMFAASSGAYSYEGGLTSNTEYWVAVQGYTDALGMGPLSARLRFLTLPTRPVLRKAAVTSSFIAFTFAKQPGVAYTATASSAGAPMAASKVVLAPGAAGRVTISGLAPNANVTVRVTASNATRGGGAVTSVAASARTSVGRPARVTGIKAGPVINGRAALQWSRVAATGASVTYRYRWVRQGSTAWSAWVASGTTKGTTQGWLKGRTYVVQVQAVNSGAGGLAGDVGSATFTAT